MDIWARLHREWCRTPDPDAAALRVYRQLRRLPGDERRDAVYELLKAALTVPHGTTVLIINRKKRNASR